MEPPSGFIEDRWFWHGALGCLILAGLTGAFFRFGIGYGLTLGLDLSNVRHAHSHLMLLGFVTLGLVAAATYVWGRVATRGRVWLYAAVLLVIASLLPLTPAWPMAWRGSWILLPPRGSPWRRLRRRWGC